MTPDEKDDLAASLSLDMANARAERWRVRTMEARARFADIWDEGLDAYEDASDQRSANPYRATR